MKYIQILKFLAVHHKTAEHFKISIFDSNQHGSPENPQDFSTQHYFLSQLKLLLYLPHPSVMRESHSCHCFVARRRAKGLICVPLFLFEGGGNFSTVGGVCVCMCWGERYRSTAGKLLLREEGRTSAFWNKGACLGRRGCCWRYLEGWKCKWPPGPQTYYHFNQPEKCSSFSSVIIVTILLICSNTFPIMISVMLYLFEDDTLPCKLMFEFPEV